MIKHAEQTTAKQQERILSPRQMSVGGNNRNKTLKL